MSEQKQRASGFMQELDRWTEATIIDPLTEAGMDETEEGYQELVAQFKRAIRQKVLESYHNGQQAGPRKGGRYGR